MPKAVYYLLYPFYLFYKIVIFFALHGLRLVYGLQKKYHWTDAINSQIFIGGAPMITYGDMKQLRNQGVTAIINTAPEALYYPKQALRTRDNYLFLPVFDRTAPSLTQMRKGVVWMDERLERGEKILVHCAFGLGRSVTLVIAYLMYKQQLSIDDALKFIQRKRPQANPTLLQIRSLEKYANYLAKAQKKSS